MEIDFVYLDNIQIEMGISDGDEIPFLYMESIDIPMVEKEG